MCFLQVSIHNPRSSPRFFGKMFGKTFGKGALHPYGQREKKSGTPCVQRDSAICEKFSKKICAFPKDFPKNPNKALFIVYANAYPAGHIGHIPNKLPRRSRHKSFAQD